jgi:hypothetical protein
VPATSLVPPPAAAFIAETRPYDPPVDIATGRDAYALREALLAALAADRAWAESSVDLRQLHTLAQTPTLAGARLRAWLTAAPAERRPALLRALLIDMDDHRRRP